GEHRAVDREVDVVGPVEGVEVHGARAGQILLVRGGGEDVVRHDAPVVAAQHLEVGRHVEQVPGVGYGAAQPVGDGEGRFGGRRHLHQVDVQVDDAGVVRAGVGGEGRVEDGLGLQGAGALGGVSGAQVPQLPGGEVHLGVGAQRGDVRVVGGEPVHLPHAVRVGLVRHRAVGDGPVPGVAGAQGADQGLFDGGDAGGGRVGPLDGLVRAFDGAGEVVAVEGVPRLVVVGPEGVGDAPVGHGAVGIGRHRLLEAGDRLLVVEGVGPHQ